MAEEITLSEFPEPEAQEPEKKVPKKRATIASLGADFKTLESFMDEEIIPAIELIEDRVNKLIAGMKQTPLVETPLLEARLQTLEAGGQRTVIEVADNVEARIQALESVGLENLPSFISDTTEQFEHLKEGLAKHNDTLMSDVKTRLDVLDKSTEILADNQELFVKVHKQMQEDLNVINNNTNQMQDAIIALQKGETAEAPEPHIMADWIKSKPEPTGHAENMARVCVSMSDILLLCRYLKADPEIPEEERIETLHIACQRAGVPVSAGIKARAGVKFIET